MTERGIDTGLISAEKITNFNGEYFVDANDTITGLYNCNIQKLNCKDSAKILSEILPEKSPGVYIYENSDGQRFMVIAEDMECDTPDYGNMTNINYYNNYYRQKQLIDGVEYLCGKRLPAICEKNPNLYILAAKNDSSMSVLMLNIYADDIINPIITLDKEYKEVKFVNCNGSLKGDKLYFEDISPFGFAAFEVI